MPGNGGEEKHFTVDGKTVENGGFYVFVFLNPAAAHSLALLHQKPLESRKR